MLLYNTIDSFHVKNVVIITKKRVFSISKLYRLLHKRIFSVGKKRLTFIILLGSILLNIHKRIFLIYECQ